MRLCGSAAVFLVSFLFSFHAQAQDSLLTIQEAIRQAIEHNFEVRISRNEKEISEINKSWGMADALPQVSATATKTFGTNDLRQKLSNGTVTEKKGTTTQGLAAGVAVNWRIFDGFKMFATKARLEELERMGEYAFRKVVNETVYDVIAQYYRIVTFDQQLRATEEQIGLFEDRLNLSRTRFEIGTGARYEILEAEVDLNEQKSNLINIQGARAKAKSTLSSLLGKTSDTSFIVADTIFLNTLPIITETRQKIESQNPDMLMANSNLSVLHYSKREINAALLPTVTVNGFYNFNRSSSSAGFNLFNQTYGPSGSIGLSVPIFNGGKTRKQLQVADIHIRNQQIEIDRVRNDIETMVSNAYIDYEAALKTIQLERANVELANENIKIAMERYRLLNITAVELRQIQLSYNAAQFRLINALYEAKATEALVALLMGDVEAI